ncbi:MAG TPA: hypothetical protein VKC34_06970, partial [Blastocatellia bacterium]|nr:hypothetical protein [Blastocatellia bacterium]
MDPTLADGTRETVTENDLAALRSFGYAVRATGASPAAPAITHVSFNGKKLKITGAGFSGQSEVQVNGLTVSTAVATNRRFKRRIKAVGRVAGRDRVLKASFDNG